MIQKNQAGWFEKEIDGQKYEFSKWGAEESLDVLIDISKLVGKPLGMLMAGGNPLEREMTPEIMGAIMDAFMSSADKTTVKGLIKKLASGESILCNGAKLNFNQHYEDRLDHLFSVCAAALEVQYGSFFDGIIGRISKVMPKPKAGIKNQT